LLSLIGVCISALRWRGHPDHKVPVAPDLAKTEMQAILPTVVWKN